MLVKGMDKHGHKLLGTHADTVQLAPLLPFACSSVAKGTMIMFDLLYTKCCLIERIIYQCYKSVNAR